ncbi:hypothetical protein LIL_30053 (plasmid) [Leptospira interrogans serovar Linhai str. 56609]|nr:hypothetical protein LIL_30053 [Leptospira interrogans serovar Linhai str. 56609]
MKEINLTFGVNSKNSSKGHLFLKRKNITSKKFRTDFIENLTYNRFIRCKICLKKNDRRYKYIDSTDFSKYLGKRIRLKPKIYSLNRIYLINSG